MSIIYKPKGAALEYCELALNIYSGCSHACQYCYAAAATFKTREAFIKAKIRINIMTQIAKEAPQHSGKEVLLCFTCDPYQWIDSHFKLTRLAIMELQKNGVDVTVLTKGGKRSERDFDLLQTNGSKYGASLTFLIDIDSIKWEPGASLPGERIETLKKAKSLGIKTWASLEPVIDPWQTLEIIKKTHEFVDIFKVGKLNHNKRAKEIDWKRFGNEAIDLLESYGKEYYIKNDLRTCLSGCK